METFLQLTAIGVGNGAVYALLALGFVIIYKSTGAINFAHGSFVLLGGFVVALLKDDLGWPMAVLAGIATAGLGAVLIERALVSRARLATHESLALMTIGIDVIVSQEILRRLALSTPYLGDPYDTLTLRIGDIVLFRTQFWAAVVAVVLTGAFFLAFRYSEWGISMRALSEDREAAALVGIRSSLVTASSWCVAGLLAGIAAVFIATQDFGGAGLGQGTHAAALVAFPAAIIGGMDSTLGAIFGALIVGLTQVYSGHYIGFDFAKSAVFIVMLIVLIARPSGLFGGRVVHRV
ncbi:branched-chain amino acid ABC transporter permease [Nonomuraea wenchangensis]|uniref:branched-chain amino acid ABC transporter permease n=1 Tax=Nonomuraea wenchangensis TaxID=568860 RepID=UPI00384E2981